MPATLFLFLLVGDDGFRCPDTRRLISVGESTMLVRQKCREPDDRAVRTETRVRRVRVVRGNAYAWLDEEYTVQVEDWLYDFGRHEFIRQLRFENGDLYRVTTGGYGGR